MLGGSAVLLLLAGGLSLLTASRDAVPSQSSRAWPSGVHTALAVHPTALDQLALATDEGLFLSHDRGTTWRALPWPDEIGPVTRLLFAHGSVDTLYAAGPTGLAMSRDGGHSWQSAGALAGLPLSALASSPADGALYAAAAGRLWRNGDLGSVWIELMAPLRAGNIHALAPHPISPHVLYAGAEGGLYVSGDRGTSWHPIRENGLHGAIAWLAVARIDDQTQIVAGGGDNVWISDNDGATWVPLAASHWIALREQANWPPLPVAAQQSVALWVALTGEPLSAWPSLAPDERPLLAAVTQDAPYHLYLGTQRALYGLHAGQGAWQDLGAQQVDSAPIGSDSFGGLAALPPFLASAGLLLGVGAAGAQWLGRIRSRRQRSAPLEHGEERWDDIIAGTLLRHQQVTPELLERIPAQARVRAMIRYVDAHSEQALDLYEHPPLIAPAHGDRLRQFIDMWSRLVDDLNGKVAAAGASRLVEHLCALLAFEPIEHRVRGPLAAYMVEAPALQLSLPARFPIILLLKADVTRDDLPTIRALMSALKAVSFFALLIPVADPPDGINPGNALQALQRASTEDLVVLDYAALCGLHLAADPQAHLVQSILGQVDLSVVSPYVQSGPVPMHMFYGRDHEIKLILRTLQDRSCAILGGRKIGKTSVLNSVYHQLQRMGSFAPSYIDCHHVTNYQAFFQALSAACNIPIESATPDLLRRVVVRLRRRQENTNRALVLLLDEVDLLLRHDLQQGVPLLSVFRALSQEKLCRFVLCGERVLNSALGDHDSPLHDSCSPVRLGYLQERDARWIVQEPMRELGIAFETPETMLQEIVTLSGCHPNIVQAICQQLIERVSQREERVIRAEDLAWVRGSTEFRDLFFEVSWGNATTLERLITVLMTEHEHFGPQQMLDALYAVGITVSNSELAVALEGLILTSLLKQQGSQLTFTTPAFGRVLREAGLTEGFRESLLSRLREERG